MTEVAVVGGGITGLVAARALAQAGATVTVHEPGPLGGKLQTTPFAGGVLDEAADAFLARVPEGVDLCRDLGLAGELVSPAARNAFVWVDGALRPLPKEQVLGVPTDLEELQSTGIVSAAGVRALRHDLADPLVAPDGDVAIGPLLRSRLGDEVVDRLVDPLVGGINAGAVDRLSLAATVPQLDAAVRSGETSLLEACRAQRARVSDPAAPVFFAPRGGMVSIVDALVADLEGRGARVRRSAVVDLAASAGGRVELVAGDGGRRVVDAVVIAAPAGPAAGMLRSVSPRAATLLATIPYASVAMVSLAVDRHDVGRELDGSGFLVPRTEGLTITACSWVSSKWDHLGGDGAVWLRASVGRDGQTSALDLTDDELVSAVLADLSTTMSLRGAPQAVRVTRWDRSFPQYRPDHLVRVDAIDALLAEADGAVAVAGAALRGLGVPACIRQGRAAAARILAARGG